MHRHYKGYLGFYEAEESWIEQGEQGPIAVQREFEILGMKESETVNKYFARTLIIANKMKLYGEMVTETTIVEKVLRSMPEKFKYIVCAIEESNNVSTLSVDHLQSSLLVHEQRMRGHKEGEQALKVISAFRTGGRGRERFGRGGRGRGRTPFNKENVVCYKYHKLGHFQYECPSWEESANYTELDDDEELLLMAHSDMKEKALDKEVWFVDFGCSNHMCGVKEWFHEIDEGFQTTVKLGDDSKMLVKGRGDIKLQTGGLIQVITEVYFIPELKNNLLSIG